MYNFFRFGRSSTPLSILELVNAGNLNLRLAAILWLMMENRSSVVVAAGPNMAGKTATLNALLDFLPPEIDQVYLSGNFETFDFVEEDKPSTNYMVVEEFNTYLDYVWGETAIKAFDLLEQGYSLGGTIHANTPREVVYLFHRYLGLSLPLISNIDVIVTLRVSWELEEGFELLRQINSVSMLIPEEDSISLAVLFKHTLPESDLEFANNDQIRQVFFKKYGVDYPDIAEEISVREQYLAQQLIDLKLSHYEVREAIVDFYRSRQQ
jgi:hypothetical protein